MKLTHLALVCMLISAVFSAAQSAPQAQPPDAAQSTPQPATSTDPVPEQTPPPPAQPSAAEPAQPSSQTPDQAKAPDPAKDSVKDSPSPKKDEKTTSGTSNDRLFFALPNFLTVDKNGKIIPLTVGQKFKVVARGSFDPVQIPWYAILAGISQAENSEPGFGQGWEGYGKRVACYAADGTIQNFFVGAIMPSIFRQDPRFFPSGKGSFFHRAGYAASRIVITRGDNGNRQFNVSEVLGSAMSSSISTYSYHPESDRTIGNVASVWVSQMGYDTITLMLKEFWPDIRRKIKREPKPQPETQSQSH